MIKLTFGFSITSSVYLDHMIKDILVTLFLVFLVTFTAQSQQVDWLKTGGGGSNDAGMGIAVDQLGNNYSVGVVFTGTTFNPKWGSDTISKGKNNS